MGKEALTSMGEVANCPDMEKNVGLETVREVKGDIRFENVSFAYPKWNPVKDSDTIAPVDQKTRMWKL